MRFRASGILCSAAGIVALSTSVQTTSAQDNLRLPERAPSMVGPSLRVQEVRPSVVVKPPSSGSAVVARSNVMRVGSTERLRWRTYKPTVSADSASPPSVSSDLMGVGAGGASQVPGLLRSPEANEPQRKARFVPTDPIVRGFILLPGETALELAGTPGAPSALAAADHHAGADAVRKHLRTYTAGVRAPKDFVGVKAYGITMPDMVEELLHDMIGIRETETTDREAAEAVILACATNGVGVEDVVVIRDEGPLGIYKIVVFTKKS